MVNQKTKKILGIVLIAIGIFIFSPIPSPDDFIIYPVFSSFMGWDVSMQGFQENFISYLLITSLIGIILIVCGANFLGWNLKQLWKKLNIQKYYVAVGLATLAVISVSLFDIWSMNSGIFGTVAEYTAGNYSVSWWDLFFKFVLMFFLAVPICYYFLVRKDFSECIGLFGASLILYFFGLADLFYFILQKVPIPSELPWLTGNPYISFVSTHLGYSLVTNFSLLASVFVGFILTFLYVKILKEKF